MTASGTKRTPTCEGATSAIELQIAIEGGGLDKTDRADFTFVAKEYHQQTPWIAAEQLAGNKLVLPGLIGFDLASPGAGKVQ